jgi:iron-sulfur cluster assembly protein
MIITEEAQREIVNHAKYLRITASIGGCAGFQYHLEYVDEMSEGDVAINDFVITNLESKLLIENIVLDFVDAIERREFVITNKRAIKQCGCGNSFGV